MISTEKPFHTNTKEKMIMSHLQKLQSAMKAAHTEAIVVSSEIN